MSIIPHARENHDRTRTQLGTLQNCPCQLTASMTLGQRAMPRGASWPSWACGAQDGDFLPRCGMSPWNHANLIIFYIQCQTRNYDELDDAMSELRSQRLRPMQPRSIGREASSLTISIP